jgi:hypothetical protein
MSFGPPLPAEHQSRLQAMQVTRSKIIALVIALGYLAPVIVVAGWDIQGAGVMCLMLSMPLVFIWFPEKVEAHTRRLAERTYSRIDTETPAFVVTLVGWVWLVGYLPLLAYLLAR